MKISVITKDLGKALSVANRFVSPKAQLPILGNVKLRADKNHLSVMATNLEMGIAIKLGAKVESEGDITIPARSLGDIITNLNTETVELSVKEEVLSINASDFSAELNGMNSADFPEIPESLEKGGSVKTSEIVSGLNKTLFAVSLDETRPTLTGVLFKKESGNRQTLISSDGFRLSQVAIGSADENLPEEIIVPKSVLMEFAKISETEETALVEFDKENNQMLFGVGNIVLSSRIIEGEFPNVQNIIPKSTRTKVSVAKEDLLRAVKLSSVIARGSGNVIKLEVQKDGLSITAENAQSGSQKAKIDAKVDGESGLTISFNYRFIEEFLNAIKGSSIELGFNDTTSPGLFLDADDENYLHLVMPVRD